MKNLTKNLTYSVVYQILILIIPFITSPYVSRVLGAGGLGLFSYSYSIALYFTYFILLGIANYGNREIANVQNKRHKRSVIFSELYTMQLCLGIIVVSIYIIYMIFLAQDKMSALIMTFCVISSIFDINWFFMGMELFKLTVIRNSIIKILSTIAIFVFVNTKSDVYTYIFIMSISTLISQLSLWTFLKKYVVYIKPKPKKVINHFKPNLKLFIPVIAVSVYKMLDKVMLGSMSTMSEVGYFENAEKIINMVDAPITAVGSVMLPRITANLSVGNKIQNDKYLYHTMKVVLFYSNAVMLGLILIGPNFSVLFFGQGFQKSGVLIQYLAITTIFLASGNVLRTQYLIPKKMDNIYINSAIIGAVGNFLLNLFLIPLLGAVGTVFGTIFAEVSVCIYQFFKIRKEIRLKRIIFYELIFFFIGLIMFFSVRLLPNFGSIIEQLVMEIVVGALIYLTVSFIFFKFYKG